MIADFVAALVRIATGCRGLGIPIPSNAPRVYYANHTSHLDALVIWASLPSQERSRCRPVAARDYWAAGPIRRFVAERALKVILIDREQITRGNNPMIPICNALREGSSLILFPEGTRGDGDTPGPFRAGIYHVAREVNEAEFVPVLLNNLNRILPKGEILIVPVIGSVHFGPPVMLTPDENRRDFLDRLRAALLELREA